ncbi:MAG: hypothetical protein Kow00108_15470 [Calditrichia bacterium]
MSSLFEKYLNVSSLKRKLILIIFLAAIFIATIAVLFFSINQVNILKRQSFQSAETIAALVADYCSVDLYFNDVKNAQVTVDNLRESHNIINVIILDKNNKLFVVKNKDNVKQLLEYQSRPENVILEGAFLFKKQPILLNEELIGTLILQYSMKPYYQQRRNIYYFSVMLLLILFIISFLVAWQVEGIISRPILQLTALAEEISERGNFDIEIPELQTKDEISTLYKAFSGMISAIDVYTTDLSNKNEELEDAKTYFQSLWNSSPDGLFIMKKSGNIVDANDTFLKMFKFSREEIEDISFAQIIKTDLLIDDVVDKLDENGREISEFESMAQKSDGTEFFAEIRFSSLKLKRTRYIIGIIADITKRKKAEQQALRLKNYLNNIVESFPSALITIDEHYKVTFWNRMVSEYFGIASEQSIGGLLWELVPDLRILEPYVKVVLNSGEAQTLYKQSFKIQDDIRLCDVYVFPIRDPEGIDVAIRIDDITEVVMKEEQLRQAQKMETIGTLAGGFAHDFNNVLGAILGNLSLLRFMAETGKGLTSEKLIDKLMEVETSAERASEMVKQLLTLSRKQDVRLEPVDLMKVLQDVKMICQNSFDKRINISFPKATEVIQVEADENQLAQVFLNLCINAAHAMTIMRESEESWGGKLEIDIHNCELSQAELIEHPDVSPGKFWVVTVKDTGVGMTPDVIGKIFDPFFTTKGKGSGTGLGLAMAYSIIRQHGGFIEVRSELNKGSEFFVYLPVSHKHKIKKNGHEDKITDYFSSGKILVIDDEAPMRNTAKAILSVAGYDVDTASSGTEAITKFEKNSYDMVILDFLMPEMTGHEVYKELRKRNPGVKVLLSTGFIKDERIESMMNDGILDYVSKPFTMLTLLKKVYQIINN